MTIPNVGHARSEDHLEDAASATATVDRGSLLNGNPNWNVCFRMVFDTTRSLQKCNDE